MKVSVVGRVPREGTFPIRLGSTRLTEVVAAAGGLLEDADRSAIRLVRLTPGTQSDAEFDRLLRLSREDMTRSEYEAFRAQLAARSPDIRVDWTLLEEGRTDLDLLMQDGDVIRIERRTNAVRVDGQVLRPGIVPYVAGKPFHWYIEQAGGYTQRASIGQARVTRAANGQGMLARDVGTISPGDQLWIPEKSDATFWKYFTDALVVAAQLATVWLAVRPL
jgi:protein involved in polysaccharide export with SLBB domain